MCSPYPLISTVHVGGSGLIEQFDWAAAALENGHSPLEQRSGAVSLWVV